MSKFKEGDIVVLKTRTYEERNPRVSRKLFGTLYEDTSTNISFIPPYMTVLKPATWVKDDKESTPEKIKKKKTLVKCMWYCNESNKYSERDFLEETLELCEEPKEELITSTVRSFLWVGAGLLTAYLVKRKYDYK
ncbi:hypothetical protein V9L05_03685 [Bernardetia sp. Wsw4-3y2]|uniref:hypothetical protein n=1 Tax=Bernardetia sp. Wsw4-3y2 TaxID=3127471 RepID=UPI0030D42AAE